MGSLVDKLKGVAIGLAGCVAGTNKPPIVETTNVPAYRPPETVIEIPAGVDYTQIGWDRAHIMAETMNGHGDPEIHLHYLRFEPDLTDGRTKVIRVLDEEERTRLGIRTRQDLFQYLGGKAKKHSGYIGPNMFI